VLTGICDKNHKQQAQHKVDGEEAGLLNEWSQLAGEGVPSVDGEKGISG
jgi:hypothetical protein